MTNSCSKHWMAKVYFSSNQCPVCSTAKKLWADYRHDFIKAVSKGILNNRLKHQRDQKQNHF